VGEAESDPLGDKADHHRIARSGAADPTHQSLSESGSDDDREVYMVGQCEQPTKKPSKRLPGKPRKRLPVRPDWNKRQSGKYTTTGKMIQDHQGMVLGMAPLLGDTTQSITCDTHLVVSSSEIDHSRSVRNSTGSSIRESRSTARRHTMPWPRG
jgi:hypothetical protein